MCCHCMNRRTFGGVAAAGLAGGILALSAADAQELAFEPWNPDKPLLVTGKPLRVQPILMHARYSPRAKTSWRSWSRIINDAAAAEEVQRIEGELKALKARAPFPIEFLPTAKVVSREAGEALQKGDFDVVLLYAASGGHDLFRACSAQDPARDTILFLRHTSGPTYYWYECFGTRHAKPLTPDLARQASAKNHGPVTLDDAVVDDYGEVLWRLRGLYGLKNLVGQRIVALGGAQGKWDGKAPTVARERYLMEIVEVGYDALAAQLKAALADTKLRTQAEAWAKRYLALRGTTLEAKREHIPCAFILYTIFRNWLREHRAPAFTIHACMGAVMNVADTTACLALSLLNDEGYMAFCESDFVIIPAGILLHYVAGTPVFLHNSTFPHKGMVTCAHCTAPRRMDGKRYEPARIVTHYESDFGAAPKVAMPIGQKVTFVDPEYSTPRWLGMTGIVRGNPFYAICRSQQDVEIQGDWKRLIPEARDSHWMMAYGDHLASLGYAARRLGIEWIPLSEA